MIDSISSLESKNKTATDIFDLRRLSYPVLSGLDTYEIDENRYIVVPLVLIKISSYGGSSTVSFNFETIPALKGSSTLVEISSWKSEKDRQRSKNA